MRRTIFSAVLVAGLGAVVWFPAKANAQNSSPQSVSVTTNRPPTVADGYLRGYLIMLDGDKLRKAKDFTGAYYKYRDARDVFDSVHAAEPAWNSEIVAYRRKKIRDSMEEVRHSEMQRRADGGGPPRRVGVPPDAGEAGPAAELPDDGPETWQWLPAQESLFRPQGDGVKSGDIFRSRPPANDGAAPAPAAGSVPAPNALPDGPPPVPNLTSSITEGNIFTLSFTTINGISYQLEASRDLRDWSPLGEEIKGDGAETSFSTQFEEKGRWFFRIRSSR